MVPVVYVQMFFCFVAGYMVCTARGAQVEHETEGWLALTAILGILGFVLGASL